LPGVSLACVCGGVCGGVCGMSACDAFVSRQRGKMVLVAIGISRRGEAEDRRGVQHDRHWVNRAKLAGSLTHHTRTRTTTEVKWRTAVRDHGRVDVVVLGLVGHVMRQRGNRVAHPVL
jgi:hypothetical protein